MAKYCVIVALLFATILGISGLVLEYGFVRYDSASHVAVSVPPAPLEFIHAAQYIAIICFIAALWMQQIFMAGRADFFKGHILEIILSLAAVYAMVVMLGTKLYFTREQMEWVTLGLKIYLVLNLFIVLVKLNTWFVTAMIHPARAIVAGFIMVILVGALLLTLPCATYQYTFPGMGHNFVESLFTSTSAVCVTGLTVADTATHYTPFGQLVIMILIQLGGIGIVIFGTIFAILVGRHISIQEESAVRDLYSEQGLGQIRRVVKFILISTLLIEAVGALLMFGMFGSPNTTAAHQAFKSIFHSISAFCNAGFALQTDNMIGFAKSWQSYLVMLPLIVLGGIGFPVLFNLAQICKDKFLKKFRPKRDAVDLERFRKISLTLHTKAVLITTLFLIIAGTGLIFVMEMPSHQTRWGRKVEFEDIAVKKDPNAMEQHTAEQRLLDALFLSVSARTAGFNTVDTSAGTLKPQTFLLLTALMFIGGSPASTAGGIKTVTFILLLAVVISTIRYRTNVEMFKRRIEFVIIKRAMVVVLLFFLLVWTTSLLLTITHPQMSYLGLLFESASACGTVGYSTGITPHLSTSGRIIIMFAMLTGRLGPLTLLFAMTKHTRELKYEYPKEELITG